MSVSMVSSVASFPAFASVNRNSADYDAVVRDWPQAKREEMEARMGSVPDDDRENGIKALLNERSLQWLDIFRDDNCEAFALFALRRGQISKQQWQRCQPFFQGAKDYHEVVRRLPKAKLEEIEARIGKVPIADMEKGIKALLNDKDPSAWLAIFKDNNLPEYALFALRRGQISQQHYGTCMYFWGASQFTIKHAFPLFTSSGILGIFDYDFQQLSKAKQGEFERRVKELPPSEQLVLIVERPPFWPTDVIRAAVENNLEWFNSYGGDFYVPSIGIMQILGDLFCDQGSLQLNPVLGLSTLDDVRASGGNDKSDMAVPHPVAKLPKTADFGFVSPGVDYTYHDFYHFMLRAFTSKAMRHLALAVSDVLLPLIAKGYGVRRLQFLVMDMENSYNKPNALEKKKVFISPQAVLWLHICEGLAKANLYQKSADTLLAAKKIYQFLTGPKASEKGVSVTAYNEILTCKPLFEGGQVFARMGACLFFHSLWVPEMAATTLPTKLNRLCLDYLDEITPLAYNTASQTLNILNDRPTFVLDRVQVHKRLYFSNQLSKVFSDEEIGKLIIDYNPDDFTSLDPDL